MRRSYTQIKPQKGTGKVFQEEGKTYEVIALLPDYVACVELSKKGIPFGVVRKFNKDLLKA